MQNLSYNISATLNDYSIDLNGEKEDVQTSYDNLRQLAIEVSKFFSPNENGVRQLGDFILTKVVKGALEKKLLVNGLRMQGYEALINQGRLETNAPLFMIIKINNQLFHSLQAVSTSMNKDVRKFISLVMLEFTSNERDIINFALDQEFLGVDKRNNRYILLRPMDEVIQLTRERFNPSDIVLDAPEFSDILFEGGTITFEED